MGTNLIQRARELHSRRNLDTAIIAGVFRPFSAVPPSVSSLPSSATPAAGVVVPAPHVVLLQEEEKCVGVAKDCSVEELAAAEQAHSGWAPADCLAAPSPDGSFLAEYLAALPVDGSLPFDYLAGLLVDDSFPLDYLAALPADGSLPAGCLVAQAGRGERHCSLDARPA